MHGLHRRRPSKNSNTVMNDPLAMTPVEFEIFVRKFLEEQAGTLTDFVTGHLEKVQGVDGDYIIDVTARFEALGAAFLVLIECKRYTSESVEREEVQALNQKKLSTGAQKAMLFTTSRFRKGAKDFAVAHGIALIRITADEVRYDVRSWLPGIRMNIVVPENGTFADFLSDRPVRKESARISESELADVQAWKIGVMKDRLDYLRIIAARGYEVKGGDIESLKAEIDEEEAKLTEMRRSKI